MSDTEHTPMPEPARRIEVFTGAGRRRNWSAVEKARIIAESYGEGETVSAVARRHGLTTSQLFWWRRAARDAEAKAGRQAMSFAPVVVSGTPAVKDERAMAMNSSAGRGAQESCGAVVEIVFGAALVRVRSGADAGTLSAVLAAIRDSAG